MMISQPKRSNRVCSMNEQGWIEMPLRLESGEGTRRAARSSGQFATLAGRAAKVSGTLQKESSGCRRAMTVYKGSRQDTGRLCNVTKPVFATTSGFVSLQKPWVSRQVVLKDYMSGCQDEDGFCNAATVVAVAKPDVEFVSCPASVSRLNFNANNGGGRLSQRH